MKKEDQYRWIKDYVDHPWKNKLRIALKFSVSLRTVNRWIAGYKKHGKSFFVHGNATLEPDCKISVNIPGSESNLSTVQSNPSAH